MFLKMMDFSLQLDPKFKEIYEDYCSYKREAMLSTFKK